MAQPADAPPAAGRPADASPGYAAASHEPCDEPAADPWVIEQTDRIRTYDGLFGFAVTEFGQPIDCHGTITDEFDGAAFGKVAFRFPEHVRFELETMPPALLVVTLSSGLGFGDPARVQQAVRSYTTTFGLSIVWEAPERSVNGDVITEQFWDPEPGLNGSATFTWSSGALLSVRISRAP